MEALLLDILTTIKQEGPLEEKALTNIIQRHNKLLGSQKKQHSKKRILPFYLKVKDQEPSRWESWGVDSELEAQLVRTVQVKPRRTASGVATVTVITKPWKCSSDCLYCPNDLRMPKSYLADEPACQRAERNFFDPYLQAAARLQTLVYMGHPVDKIELIILGGTWSDYSEEYQIWFVHELFRALNDIDIIEEEAKKRRQLCLDAGLSETKEALIERVSAQQEAIKEGRLSYNQAVVELYEQDAAWIEMSSYQRASFEDLTFQQKRNETAKRRMVGLVIETRPDTINPKSLYLIRRLGCTKIQMGIQSLDAKVLEANERRVDPATIERAFALVRLFGFKLHTHFMVNLYGSDPVRDKADYLRFVTDPAFLPDEVKIYPCALVEGSHLCKNYHDGSWRPYTEDELIDVLATDILATPRYTRISRMIRDISAHDIMVGNKKTNLRQLVERAIEKSGKEIPEIRYREIKTAEVTFDELSLDIFPYETTVSQEYFLQWITADNRIAGFLRLSLPHQDFVSENASDLPISLGEAMIREVHVYGKVARLKQNKTADDLEPAEGLEPKKAQHTGLGKQLIEKALEIAYDQGFTSMNVISSVGTRKYYRRLGFVDDELYQKRPLP